MVQNQIKSIFSTSLLASLLASLLLLLAACTLTSQVPEATAPAQPEETVVPEPTAELVGSPTEEPVEEPTDGAQDIPPAGFEDMVVALLVAGYAVELSGSVEQPFFSVPGKIVLVDGAEVQLFEYADNETAAAEAALIAPDASSVGTSTVAWMATPHFYAKDNIIVLYVGDDTHIIEGLTGALGQPAAEGQGLPLPLGDTVGALGTALSANDYATLQGLMNDPFTIGYWQSEGQVLTPAEAEELLRLSLLPNPAAVSFVRDPAQIPDLGGIDPYQVLGPDANIVEVVYSQGWGSDGQGEAILLISVGPADERYWRGMIYGPAGFTGTTAPAGSTVEALAAALAANDYAALQRLMSDPFTIGYWLSEGQVLTPAEAEEQLRLNLLPNPAAVSFVRDPAQFPDLGGFDPYSAFGPEANIVDLVYSQGWGGDGLDEAILMISEDAAGQRHWRGIIYGPAGFSVLMAPPSESTLPFEPAVYRNEENGFEFDYPASWTFDEEVLGSRASGAQFMSDGETVMSAVVYLWDPKGDLDGFIDRWRQSMSSSNITILSEVEMMLEGERRAVEIVFEDMVGKQVYLLFTIVGDNYLEMAAYGNLQFVPESAQTLRPIP